jgi:hypothetical protein
MQHLKRQAGLAALMVSLSGCATMFNPGGVETVPNPPAGWSGKVMKLDVYRMPRSGEFYVNGSRINLANVRRTQSALGDGFDMVVMIPQDVPVDLRIIDGARTASARVQAKLQARWIYFNLLLGPAIPVGLIVDSRTKKWTYLRENAIDATSLLERAAADAGKSSRDEP